MHLTPAFAQIVTKFFRQIMEYQMIFPRLAEATIIGYTWTIKIHNYFYMLLDHITDVAQYNLLRLINYKLE